MKNIKGVVFHGVEVWSLIKKEKIDCEYWNEGFSREFIWSLIHQEGLQNLNERRIKSTEYLKLVTELRN